MVGRWFQQLQQTRYHQARLRKGTLSSSSKDLPQTMRRGEFGLQLLTLPGIQHPQESRYRLEQYPTISLAQYSPEAAP